MRYLVTMEPVETAIPRSPQQLVQYIEQVVIASHEACAKLEAEKKSWLEELWLEQGVPRLSWRRHPTRS